MATTGQRLVEISQLASGTAAQHLRAAGVTGVTAGDLLVAYSQLPTATAIVHLLQTVQRQVAGGVPTFRRMVTTPSVVSAVTLRGTVKFPTTLVVAAPLIIVGAASPIVSRAMVSVVELQQKPSVGSSAPPIEDVMYTRWKLLRPTGSATVPAFQSSVAAVVVSNVTGRINSDGRVVKPKTIKNPSEQDIIAMLFF